MDYPKISEIVTRIKVVAECEILGFSGSDRSLASFG